MENAFPKRYPKRESTPPPQPQEKRYITTITITPTPPYLPTYLPCLVFPSNSEARGLGSVSMQWLASYLPT